MQSLIVELIQVLSFLLASKVLLTISVALVFLQVSVALAMQLSSFSLLLDLFWSPPSPVGAHLCLPLCQHRQRVLMQSLGWVLVRHCLPLCQHRQRILMQALGWVLVRHSSPLGKVDESDPFPGGSSSLRRGSDPQRGNL